ARTSSSRLTSAGTNCERPPSEAATASPASRRRPATTTCAPSCAKRTAQARPIPLVPPVTIATLSSSRFMAPPPADYPYEGPSCNDLVCPLLVYQKKDIDLYYVISVLTRW